MNDTKIDNCKFSFKCPKKWSALTDLGIDNQRYCGACDEHVYWCDSQEDIDKAAAENRCVAFASKHASQIKTWNSDENGFLEFHMGRVELSTEDTLKATSDQSFISRIIIWSKKIIK